MSDYDTLTKHLISTHPRDWLALAGMPVGRSARAVDTDLSTVTATADKLLRVVGAAGGPYIAHVEFQAARDVRLDRRVIMYNVVAGYRHRLPVRSCVFLLRPAAAPPAVRGQVRDAPDDHTRLSFGYRLVRVWELPVADLLAGGLGTLPLATVASVSRGELPAVFRHVRDRIERDVRESWLYQEIVAEGREEGRVQGRAEGEWELLLRQATAKFGPAEAAVRARVEAITDIKQLHQLGLAVLKASSWDELFRAAVSKRRRK